MSSGDLYPSPFSERGDGFALQAVTHWLRTAPARRLWGLRAGGLSVALPEVPAALSHAGPAAATKDGYVLAYDDVSSVWLATRPDITDRYVDALRDVLKQPRVRMDGATTRTVLTGSVALFAGRGLDRVAVSLNVDDGSYDRMVDLLRNASRDARTALAMPPAPGMGAFDDPTFLAGNQAWIDGSRVLIEYPPEEGSRAETVALDRLALADAIEHAWRAMRDVSTRIGSGLAR